MVVFTMCIMCKKIYEIWQDVFPENVSLILWRQKKIGSAREHLQKWETKYFGPTWTSRIAFYKPCVCTVCIYGWGQSGGKDNFFPQWSHLIFAVLIMMVRKNCVLLAPIACPSWLPWNLSDTAKLTENCALSETLSNTAKHYRRHTKTLLNSTKHYRRHNKLLLNTAKYLWRYRRRKNYQRQQNIIKNRATQQNII